MAHLLAGVFGIIAQAQDTVVCTCSSVDKFVKHRVAVIVGILQLAAEWGAAMSANMAKIWAAFWSADTPKVKSMPLAMLIEDNKDGSTAVSDGTASSERSDNSNNRSSNNNNVTSISNNGGGAPLDVFTKARRRREAKRNTYNRAGKALNVRLQRYREASTPRSITSSTTTKTAVVTSAEPALPAASPCSTNAPGNVSETKRYAWQSFETLRTGPGDWLTWTEVRQADGSDKWVLRDLRKK